MTSLRTIKQLNEPQPVEVQSSPDGVPLKVRFKEVQPGESKRNSRNPRFRRNSQNQQFRTIRSDGQWMKVDSIEDLWKINDEWWRGDRLEIERLYFDLLLENDQRMTIFHHLVHDTWSRQAE